MLQHVFVYYIGRTPHNQTFKLHPARWQALKKYNNNNNNNNNNKHTSWQGSAALKVRPIKQTATLKGRACNTQCAPLNATLRLVCMQGPQRVITTVIAAELAQEAPGWSQRGLWSPLCIKAGLQWIRVPYLCVSSEAMSSSTIKPPNSMPPSNTSSFTPV